MKKQLIYISFIYFFIQANLAAQSFWFGPKAGGTICIQSWNGSDRQPLLGGNVALFIETTDPEKTSGSLYAQLGLHQRGSSSRTFLIPSIIFKFLACAMFLIIYHCKLVQKNFTNPIFIIWLVSELNTPYGQILIL